MENIHSSLSSLLNKVGNYQLFAEEVWQKQCHDDPYFHESDTHERILTISKRITPEKLIGIYLVGLKVSPEWIILLKLKLEELCQKRKFIGKWRILHKLLSFSSQGMALEFLLLEDYHYREISGTFLNLSSRDFEGVSFHWCKKPLARRPQRKRGYHDHGSTRLAHEKHGDPLLSAEREVTKVPILCPKKPLLRFLYG